MNNNISLAQFSMLLNEALSRITNMEENIETERVQAKKIEKLLMTALEEFPRIIENERETNKSIVEKV